MATHTVTNQAPPREGLDEFALDLPLVEGVRRHGASWAEPELTVALQGSLLVRHAPSEVADAFCAARLGDARGFLYGAAPASDAAAIVARHAGDDQSKDYWR